MVASAARIPIYHITDVENLPDILSDGGLYSDAVMAQRKPTVIGYSHIKARRLTEIRVPCCNNRFVGSFVPFYFCPRSPMLYTINRGNTGRPPGCQKSIVHLVSDVAVGIGLNRIWAISDGNAGAAYPSFFADIKALNGLDWAAIRATDWLGKTNQKMAEFLVADFFPWTGFHAVGCHDSGIAKEVQNMLNHQSHRPAVTIEPGWYY